MSWYLALNKLETFKILLLILLIDANLSKQMLIVSNLSGRTLYKL